MTLMRCSRCNEPAPGNERFCRRCGAPIEREWTTSIAADAPATKSSPTLVPTSDDHSRPKGSRSERSRRLGFVLLGLLATITSIMVVIAIVVVTSSKHSSSHTAANRSPATDSGLVDSSTVVGLPSVTHTPTTLKATIKTAAATTTPTTDAQRGAVLSVVQGLATNLARHEWVAARANPFFATTPDSQFKKAYDPLQRLVATLVRVTPTGPETVDARIGLVAWEDVGGSRTNVYCVTWTVDTQRAVVTASNAFETLEPKNTPDTLDPSTETERILASC